MFGQWKFFSFHFWVERNFTVILSPNLPKLGHSIKRYSQKKIFRHKWSRGEPTFQHLTNYVRQNQRLPRRPAQLPKLEPLLHIQCNIIKSTDFGTTCQIMMATLHFYILNYCITIVILQVALKSVPLMTLSHCT